MTPTFITTVYGERYAPFLQPCLGSIEACWPAASGIVLYQDVPEREIEYLRAAYPQWDVYETKLPMTGGVRERIPRKLHAWLAACDHAPPQGPLAFIDCDTLCLRRFDDLLNRDWDVIYTWKNEPFPINTGVMLTRDRRIAQTLFCNMLDRVERMIDNRDELNLATGASGAADQHALREIIGFVSYDRECVADVRGEQLRFLGVPCEFLNEVNCREIGEQTRLVHFKTGWHPILLDGGPFTKNRPRQRCQEMFDLWKQSRRAACRSATRAMAFSAAHLCVDRYRPIADHYEERGILHSEMLAFCSMAHVMAVDLIIETGRARGQSTRQLARFFDGLPVQITSIELTRDSDAEFAERRLSVHNNVELLYGDAHRVLPSLLEANAHRRVALLVDGPKGLEAIGLIERLFQEFPCLRFAGLHDLRRQTPQREQLEDAGERIFFTDDEQWVESFGDLDGSCLPATGSITLHTWRPYMKGEDPIPSYGPTLGMILPTPAAPLTAVTSEPMATAS